MAPMTISRRTKGIRLLRIALSGAIAAALVFNGLWLAAQLPMGPSDMIVELFTTNGPASMAGLREGVLYAALIGFFAAAIADLAYEAMRWLEMAGETPIAANKRGRRETAAK